MEELGLIGLDNFGNIIDQKQAMDIPLGLEAGRTGKSDGLPVFNTNTRIPVGLDALPTMNRNTRIPVGLDALPTMNNFNITGSPSIYNMTGRPNIYGNPSVYYNQSSGGLLDTINNISKSLFD